MHIGNFLSFSSFSFSFHPFLTNDHEFILGEAVLGNLEVQRSRALPYTTRDIVVRTVAGAEPTAEVTGFTDGHTTKVSADTWKTVC